MRVRAVVREHDLVPGAPELLDVLGDLLEPLRSDIVRKACRRQLDDAVAALVQLGAQLREKRFRDDGDPTRPRILAHRSSSTSLERSSSAS